MFAVFIGVVTNGAHLTRLQLPHICIESLELAWIWNPVNVRLLCRGFWNSTRSKEAGVFEETPRMLKRASVVSISLCNKSSVFRRQCRQISFRARVWRRKCKSKQYCEWWSQRLPYFWGFWLRSAITPTICSTENGFLVERWTMYPNLFLPLSSFRRSVTKNNGFLKLSDKKNDLFCNWLLVFWLLQCLFQSRESGSWVI